MPSVSEKELVRAAIEARKNAIAPISKFKVGAALLTKTGRVITGVNVESGVIGLTCCAERVALFKGLSEGEQNYVAIAVVARMDGGPTPCGSCRQLISEFAPGVDVFVADTKQPAEIRKFNEGELLPEAFRFEPET